MVELDRLEAFLRMLDSGQDGPFLRFSLGREYLHRDQPAEAARHLRCCLEHDPTYSAAYRALAEAEDLLGEEEACQQTLERGIAQAHENGDRQAQKEMEVLRRRLAKGRPLKGR